MISICMITKNDAKKLDKCLSLLSEYPFEIIVVDTGSSDNSIEIANKYTSHVYNYVWNDNFSDARNFSVEKASNDIILIIDTDEMLYKIDYDELVKVSLRHPNETGRILSINTIMAVNETTENHERVSRLFDRRRFSFTGRIHEQITGKDGKFHDTYNIPVTILHDGYYGTAEDINSKTTRNLTLLELEIEENGPDPYIFYQMGKSWYLRGSMEKAHEFFEKATEFDINPKLEYVTDLVVSYGYSLINTGRAEAALGLESISDEFGNSADYRFMMGLVYMNNMMYNRAVEEFKTATHTERYTVDGVNSYKANYNIGVIYECLGNNELAAEYYGKSLNYPKASERLKNLPQFQ